MPQSHAPSRIPQQKIDEVRDRTSLADVVRGHVNLKRKGRDLWGCCPFHQEKTPSFQVREAEGYYHCFGCGAHGNAIDFVMEMQGLPFPEAVEKLAASAGVTIERQKLDPAAQKRRTGGLEVLERATVWFERGLKGGAKDYFLNRGLSPATLEKFRLGYAPDDWRALKHGLQAEGFEEKTLLETALVRKSEKGGEPYDTFRNRVMFPIQDMQGRPVAFGGRVLDDSEPKYLNSPQTPFFNKSALLYALYHAAPHIRKNDEAILVEGYMDVIGLYEAGVKTAVAPMGTAVTEEQVALLWRYHDTPTVCLDGDVAGQQAATRLAYRVLGVLHAGKGLRFALMPPGHDPDTFVKDHSVAEFDTLIKNALTLEDVLWADIKKDMNLSEGQGRAATEKKITEMAAQIKDDTMKKHLSGAIKDRMWQEIKASRGQAYGAGKGKGKWTGQDIRRQVSTEHGAGGVAQLLLALVLYRPQILAHVSEEFAQLEYREKAPAHLQEKLFSVLMPLLSPKGVETDKWDAYLLKAGAKDDAQKLIAKFELGRLLANNGVSDTDEIATFWKTLFNDYQRTLRKKSATSALLGEVAQDITRDLDAWRKFKAAKVQGVVPKTDQEN